MSGGSSILELTTVSTSLFTYVNTKCVIRFFIINNIGLDVALYSEMTYMYKGIGTAA